MTENNKKSDKISKQMMALIFVPLMVPSITLVGFALSDFSRDGAMTMVIVAFFLFLINIAVFFFAYRVLNKPEPQAPEV